MKFNSTVIKHLVPGIMLELETTANLKIIYSLQYSISVTIFSQLSVKNYSFTLKIFKN